MPQIVLLRHSSAKPKNQRFSEGYLHGKLVREP
jgi:hypothetical protein